MDSDVEGMDKFVELVSVITGADCEVEDDDDEDLDVIEGDIQKIKRTMDVVCGFKRPIFCNLNNYTNKITTGLPQYPLVGFVTKKKYKISTCFVDGKAIETSIKFENFQFVPLHLDAIIGLVIPNFSHLPEIRISGLCFF